MTTTSSFPAWDASDFRRSALAWDRMSDAQGPAGQPAVRVPADVADLSAPARELLRSRLAWRCRVHDVVVDADGDPSITFVGPTVGTITTALREAADAAMLSVRADAAAGWSARDEAERFLPFSWT